MRGIQTHADLADRQRRSGIERHEAHVAESRLDGRLVVQQPLGAALQFHQCHARLHHVPCLKVVAAFHAETGLAGLARVPGDLQRFGVVADAAEVHQEGPPRVLRRHAAAGLDADDAPVFAELRRHARGFACTLRRRGQRKPRHHDASCRQRRGLFGPEQCRRHRLAVGIQHVHIAQVGPGGGGVDAAIELDAVGAGAFGGQGQRPPLRIRGLCRRLRQRRGRRGQQCQGKQQDPHAVASSVSMRRGGAGAR